MKHLPNGIKRSVEQAREFDTQIWYSNQSQYSSNVESSMRNLEPIGEFLRGFYTNAESQHSNQASEV